MARIDFAARILAGLPIASVLDVGCRGGDLADHLAPGIHYAGADLVPDNRGRVRYVGDVMTVEISETFDAVVALDILEHLESPSRLFDRLLGRTRRYLLVSLPNTYDLKSRYRFVARGQLGGKYLFREDEPRDRHRWLMNRSEIVAFYQAKAARHGLGLTTLDMGYGATGRGPIAAIGRGLAHMLPPGLATETVCGLFERRAPPG